MCGSRRGGIATTTRAKRAKRPKRDTKKGQVLSYRTFSDNQQLFSDRQIKSSIEHSYNSACVPTLSNISNISIPIHSISRVLRWGREYSELTVQYSTYKPHLPAQVNGVLSHAWRKCGEKVGWIRITRLIPDRKSVV